jgi:acetyltransferase-like isoleucine patch superfamily enzyme
VSGLRNPFAPRLPYVESRAWAFYVNLLAASPFGTRERRAQIYRRNGIETETDQIYPRCYFHSADVWLGPGVILNHGVHLENVGRVEIGARTGLGIFTTVLTSDHEVGPHECRFGAYSWRPVTIGAGCWIGARSLILPGVTIGDGCLIAAGAVVREDCAADGVYAGVPARRVRDLPG